MDEIGSILHEARISKQLSLDAAQDQLKIQSKYLSAMEEGRFDILPTAVHARGYLKNYAKFLDLDPAPLLELYQAELANAQRRTRRGKQNETSLVPETDNGFFDPVNMQLNPIRNGATGESALRLIIIFALLAAIILVASRFFVGQDTTSRNLGPMDTVTQFYRSVILGETPETAAEIAAQEEAIEESAEAPINNPLIIETGRSEVVEAVPTAVPSFVCPLNAELMTVRIDATERVWMQLYIDGELQIQDNIREGESIEYVAEDSFRINTGNAYAVYVTVNSQPLGRLGEPQQVQDVTCNTVAN